MKKNKYGTEEAAVGRTINMVTNTTATMTPGNAKAFLAESAARIAKGGSVGDAILAQEAQGQQELVNSAVLPTDGTSRPEDRAVFEAMGIQFGEPVSGDKMFVHVRLPAGWQKVATDHSMWSKLIDDKGRERARIFYKAAFYDRSAHVYPVRRFRVETVETTPSGEKYNYKDPVRAQVLDADGTVLWTSTETFTYEAAQAHNKANPQEHYSHSDLARKAGCEWLKANGYPDFNNPLAYW